MNATALAALAWTLAVPLALGGCRDRPSSDPAAAAPASLAMPAPGDSRFVRPLEIGAGAYWIQQGVGGASVVIRLDGVESTSASGLDVVRAAAVVALGQGEFRLLLAGCRGAVSRIVVLRDANGDGRVDDPAGHSDLPAGVVAEHLAVDPGQSVFFLRCIEGARLLRALDTDGDHLPDGAWREFTPPTHALDPAHDFVTIQSASRVVVRRAPPFAPDDLVTVMEDTDGDGVADRVRVEGAFASAPMAPRLRWRPRAQDTALDVRGSPGTTVALYEVDGAGVAFGAPLGSTTLDARGDGVIALRAGQPLGTHLRLKDETHGLWAQVWETVAANYPILRSASPREFLAGIGGTVTLRGSGFRSADSFKASLVESGGSGVLEGLACTVHSDTILAVAIPAALPVPAGEPYAAWHLVVASTTPGHPALGVDISVKRPP